MALGNQILSVAYTKSNNHFFFKNLQALVGLNFQYSQVYFSTYLMSI